MHERDSNFRWLILLTLAALVPTSAGRAQNLVPQGTFDTGLQGWTQSLPFGHATWSPADALGSPTSGTMRVYSSEQGGAYSDCIPMDPTRVYAFGALGYLPAAQASASGRVHLLGFLSLTDCQQLIMNGYYSLSFQDSTWAPIRGPVGYPYLWKRVFIEADNDGLPAGLDVMVDDVFICPYDEYKGDLNQDAFPDLLLRQNSTGQTYLWRMKERERSLELPLSPQPDNTPFAPRIVGSADFDRFAGSDIVFQPAFSTQLIFWFMQGATRIGTATLSGPLPSFGWSVAATGDFDDDLVPDILWRNANTQKLQVTTMGGADGTTITGTLVPSPDQAADANWTVVAALDYNGDGHRDLLWYNATTGKIVFWFLNQNLVRITGQFANPPNAGNANWKVVAGGDYGIGASGAACTNDIVWRNDTTGRMVVWNMDLAGHRVAGGFITPDPSPNATDWTVLGPK